MHAWITDPALAEIDGLRHMVTTRAGGVSAPPFDTLNVGLGSDDTSAAVRENRRRVATQLGFEQLMTPYQVHGSDVCVVDQETEARPRCDALATSRTGILLGVLGADCPGVLLVDEARHALAVAHAGWRGVAAGIVASTIDTLVRRYDCAPSVMRAWIGPGIGAPRYEVDTEVLDSVSRALPAHIGLEAEGITRPTRPGHARIDLRRAIRTQLIAAGVDALHVTTVPACTYDDAARFFSHRRDVAKTGRPALVAGLAS